MARKYLSHEHNLEKHKGEADMHVVGRLSLLALLGQTAGQDLSSCCDVLNIESTAEASEHQSNRLGQYRWRAI